MKKKAIFICFTVILSVFAFACSTAMEKRSPFVSELRDEVLVGGDERVKITVFSGTRENPYEIDGKISGEKTAFTVISVEGAFEHEPSYTLYLGGEKYDGTLSKHPFKDSYSAELAVKSGKKATLTLTTDTYAGNFELASVRSSKTISASDALEIAEERLKKSIKKMEKGNTLNAEIYVRLLKNPISSEGGYYWYVAYAPEKYSIYAVLIHSESGEIVAVRE